MALNHLVQQRGAPRYLLADNELSKKARAASEHTSAVARRASNSDYESAIGEKAMHWRGSLRARAPSRVRSQSRRATPPLTGAATTAEAAINGSHILLPLEIAAVIDCHDREVNGFEFALRGRAKEAERALEEACLARFGTLRPHGATPVVRSDNGLIFQSRRFRAACRDYRLRQEFITPYTPEQTASSNAFFAASKKSASGSIISPASARLAPPLLSGSNGTMPNGPPRLSAIAARDNFARYNSNSWLEIGGACMTQPEARAGRTAKASIKQSDPIPAQYKSQ